MKFKNTILLFAVTAVGLLLAGGILATMHIGAAAATTLNPQQPIWAFSLLQLSATLLSPCQEIDVLLTMIYTFSRVFQLV